MTLTDDLPIASCCNEAFKIATSSAAYLNNYFMLIGTDGVYSFTFEHQKREDCPVCGGQALDVTINKEWTLERLIEMLIERQDVCVRSVIPSTPSCADIGPHEYSQVKKPSLATATKQLYFQAPPQLEELTRPNLEKKVSELVKEGDYITVTASTLPFDLTLRVTFA